MKSLCGLTEALLQTGVCRRMKELNMDNKLHKHTFIINVSAIINKDGSVFIQKRSLTEDSNPGKIGLPGGKLDFEDGNVIDGVKREVREEIGLEITNLQLFESHMRLTNEGNQKLYLVFTADYAGGKPIASGEVAEIRQVKNAQLNAGEEYTPNTEEILKDYFKGVSEK